jgi:hypothetical protein
MGRLSCEGDLWLKLRSVLVAPAWPVSLIMRSESGRNKIAKRIEETNKVKRRIYFIKGDFVEAKPGQPQICVDQRR